jgi:carboxylesterase type B
MQCKLPEEADENKMPQMDGVECLNLNITVPNTHSKNDDGSRCGGNTGVKRLPVMVFIHGGGFIMGANSWPQYDMKKLVEKSVEMGMPLIGVNIKCVIIFFGQQETTSND